MQMHNVFRNSFYPWQMLRSGHQVSKARQETVEHIEDTGKMIGMDVERVLPAIFASLSKEKIQEALKQTK